MPSSTPTLSLLADRLIDGTGAAAQRDAYVAIAGNTIAAIDGQPPQADATVLSFPGCTILPGMIDAHVHLTFAALETHADVVNQVTSESDEQLLARCIRNAQAALAAGITTLRDCGGRGLITLAARDTLRRARAVGPDILVSGMPITTRTGHLYFLGQTADTAEEVRRAAEEMTQAGVDFIKLVATGGNMTACSNRLAPQYDTAALREGVDVANRAGLHTAAHVLSRCAIPQCVELGVRTIEHCSWRVSETQHEFDPALAARMRTNQQYACFTMTSATWRKVRPDLAGTDPVLFADIDDRFATERQTIDAGVPFMLHTDAGVRQTPFGPSLALGVHAARLELGLTPLEAIRAVTQTPARALGLSDRGVLAPGRRADLLIVEGNPLEDLAALTRVRAVFLAGKRIT
jgi:imidazolonepropionase-like amidohydrolase